MHDLAGGACLSHPGRSDEENASRGLVRIQKDVNRLIGLSPRKREIPDAEFLGLEIVVLALPETYSQVSIPGDVGGAYAALGENIQQLPCRDAAVYRFKGEHREHAKSGLGVPRQIGAQQREHDVSQLAFVRGYPTALPNGPPGLFAAVDPEAALEVIEVAFQIEREGLVKR